MFYLLLPATSSITVKADAQENASRAGQPEARNVQKADPVLPRQQVP